MSVRNLKIIAVPEKPGGVLPSILRENQILSVREMLHMVSPEFGPIKRVLSTIGFGDAGGGGYSGHAEIYDLDGILQSVYGQPAMDPGVNDTLFGGGKGFDFGSTTLSSLGEATERAVAGLVASSPGLPSNRLLSGYADLVRDGIEALGPDDIFLFSDEQYSEPGFLYKRFTDETILQWIKGKRLLSGKDVWVPSQLVDMVHIYDVGEEIIGYPVSGGLSCHTSYLNAAYHGLTEVIERDAINISWYTDKLPVRVRIDEKVRTLLGSMAPRLELDHSDIYLLAHPCDLADTWTFTLLGFQRWLSRLQYCSGGACDVVAHSALQGALSEYAQTRSTLGISSFAPDSMAGMSVREMFDWEPDRHPSEMKLFFQAVGYYGLKEHEGFLDDYLSGPIADWGEVQGIGRDLTIESSVQARMDILLARLANSGVDPIAFNYSHPDWRSLHIVKVFVPELTTAFLQSRPLLGHPRLATLRSGVDAGSYVKPLPYP